MSSVLVVEDEAIIAEDVRRTLEALGYVVTATATTGEEALKRVEAQPPNLVLMDIVLRGPLDGIETVERIRARWDVPIIYLTSHSDERTLARAAATSPHGYLLKPFEERELRTAIEVALKRHEVERLLAARERWFATTLRSIGDAVIATDVAERVTFMNAAAEELVGRSLEAAQGQPLAELVRVVDDEGHEVRTPTGAPLLDRFRRTASRRRLVRPDGSTREIDESAAAIVDDRGQLLGGVVVLHDITEKRSLEDRVARAERLATVGTMSAGLAHELNNPLAAIVTNAGFANEIVVEMAASLLAGGSPEDAARELASAAEALRDVERSTERMRRLILDMRRFVRAEPLERSRVDLAAAVDSAIQATAAEVGPAARVTRNADKSPLVEANEGQLVQVIANMLVNAAQAIGRGASEQHEIRVATRTDDRGWAVIEVRDDGPGMTRDTLNHVFDPFFTTKPVGAGMGLGLSVAHGIVTALGGEIGVESDVGRGALFRVALPPAREPLPVSVEPSAEPPPEAPTRRARVLVVDDEESVARGVARVLKAHHDVVVEHRGADALARIEKGERFDVIFCDVMMPEMTGLDVFEKICDLDVELAARVVFMTGGVISPRAAELLASQTNAVLRKPIATKALRALVADLMR